MKNNTLCEKEIKFKVNYEEITKNKKFSSWSYWRKSFKTTFDYELEELISKEQEKVSKTNQKTLFINFRRTNFLKVWILKFYTILLISTVDADRLDYINRDMLASGLYYRIKWPYSYLKQAV